MGFWEDITGGINAAANNVWQGVTNPGDALNSANIRMQAAARGMTVDQYMPILREQLSHPSVPNPQEQFNNFLNTNPIGQAAAPFLANGVGYNSDSGAHYGMTDPGRAGPDPSKVNASVANVDPVVAQSVPSAPQTYPAPVNQGGWTGQSPVTPYSYGVSQKDVLNPTNTPHVGMSPIYPKSNGNDPMAGFNTNVTVPAIPAAPNEPAHSLYPQSNGNSVSTGFAPHTEATKTGTVYPASNGMGGGDVVDWMKNNGGIIASGLAGTAGVIGQVAGGNAASDAAKQAGNVAANGYDQAEARNTDQFKQQQTYLNPYLEAGVGKDGQHGALGQLQTFDQDHPMGNFSQSPDYAFRLSEGMKALRNSAGAQGSLVSGETMKQMNNYAQDSASQEYGNWYARQRGTLQDQRAGIQTIAGYGQNATNQAVNASQMYSQNGGNNMIGAATAQGNAIIGAGNVNSSMYKNVGDNASAAFNNYFSNQTSNKFIDAMKNRNTGV